MLRVCNVNIAGQEEAARERFLILELYFLVRKKCVWGVESKGQGTGESCSPGPRILTAQGAQDVLQLLSLAMHVNHSKLEAQHWC